MWKKVIKIAFMIIFIIIMICIGFFAWTFYDTIRTHSIEIELSDITQEEKEKLIQLNFLEFSEYPSSLTFLTLRVEEEIRETQFYINFSIDKKEANEYTIEKNNNQSPNEISIFKISENNEEIIYELRTNFAQNSKEDKWSYLYELIEKYS